MGMEAPKATLPAKPALTLAAGGIRFGFWKFRIQELVGEKLFIFAGENFDGMLHCSGTTNGSANSQSHHPSRSQEVAMDPTLDPVYIARKQDDGTWSIVDSQTGQIADIGGCVLGRLDAAMAAGLVQDFNDTPAPIDDQSVRLGAFPETRLPVSSLRFRNISSPKELSTRMSI